MIKNCVYTFWFPIVNDIRHYLFKIEEFSSDYFTPFTLISVPDNMPPETPIIIANTKNCHTNLQISKQSIQLVTNFDENYGTDIDKCIDYMDNKSIDILKLINEILKREIYYTGIVTTICKKKDNPEEFIFETFLNIKNELPIYDVNLQISHKYLDKYYIISTIKNERRCLADFVINNLISLSNIEQISNDMIISIEINDRLAYNNDSNYRSDIIKQAEIISTAKRILKNNIDNFIKTGVLNYE